MIRIASYNIRKSLGLDRRRNPLRILDVLGQIDPDVVALQEVDRRNGRRQTTLPRDLIAEQTDYTIADIAIRPDSIGWHGNTFLFKSSITVDRLQRLELPTLEPRGAILADITARGRALRLIGLHLGLLRSYRRKQLQQLSAHLSNQPDNRPTILMGDLNEWKQGAATLAPFEKGFSITSPGPSFHSAKPLANLDRIITSNDLDIENHGVHISSQSKVASDHLPIWADVSTQNPAIPYSCETAGG